ncbi:MAG: hypothetical protein CMH54_06030 [Myxococcales bacterium]|nr:hypothetical protein [Myxococcales bacterium]
MCHSYALAGSIPCDRYPDDARGTYEKLRCWLLYGDAERATERRTELMGMGLEGKDYARASDALEKARIGEYEDAVRALRRIARNRPTWLFVHYELGRLHHLLGQTTRGNAVLDRLSELYDAGTLRSSEDLVWLGRSLHLLNHPRDANDIFREAVRKDPGRVDAHMGWGDLLLAKHNQEEAIAEYEKVLKIWPDHPLALVGKARVLFQGGARAPEARNVLQRVFSYNPELLEALVLDARISLFLEDFEGAKRRAEQVLKRNPNHRQALAILAARSFLLGRTNEVEGYWKRVRVLQPKDAGFWYEIAHFATRFHRYDLLVPILERALRLDPDYVPALVELGVAYSRMANDERARVFLSKAREADPFDKRAYFMTERLYHTILKDYRMKMHAGIGYRFERSEEPILFPLISSWIETGRTYYQRRYGFQLEPPVQIEVFKEPETFSVRTVGLPQFWAHGVCFGHVLAMRSPRSGDFNAREVILHELAHAYHLQYTGGRVPRWVTEGLAELETMRIDPTLAREIDPHMAERFRQKEMQPICILSRAFEQARDKRSMLHAYMQARLVLEWIQVRGGGKAINALMTAFRNGETVDDALENVLSLGCTAVDEAFLKWVETRLEPYLAPHPSVSGAIPSPRTLLSRMERGDGRAGALLAEHARRRGDWKSLGTLLAKPFVGGTPEGRLLQGYLALHEEDTERAKEIVRSLQDDGHGGFEVSWLMARIHRVEGVPEGAAQHLEEALAVVPDHIAILEDLVDLYEGQGVEALALKARKRLALVKEHDGSLRASLLRDLQRVGDAKAKDWLGRLMEVRPLEGTTWAMAGRLYLQGKKGCKPALVAFERARELGAVLEQDELLDEVDCRIQLGQKRKAAKLLRQLRVTDPDHPRVQSLSNEIDSK